MHRNDLTRLILAGTLLLSLSTFLGAQTSCEWRTVPSPSPEVDRNAFTAVAAHGPNLALAIGSAQTLGSPGRSLFARFDGREWREIAGPTSTGPASVGFQDLTFAPNGDAWVFGLGSLGLQVTNLAVRYRNHAWDRTSIITLRPQTAYPYSARSGAAYDALALAEDDVWFCGRAGGFGSGGAVVVPMAVHWDGTTWTDVPVPTTEIRREEMQGIDGVSSNDVWGVGFTESSLPPFRARTWHWDGSSWSIVPNPAEQIPQSFLYDVVALASNDVWAVGEQPGGALFMHWDGSSWTIAPSPSNTTTRIRKVVDAGGTLWASASFTEDFYRYDGTAWQLVGNPSVPGAASWNRTGDLEAAGACDAWTVGSFTDASGRLHTLVERLGAPCAGSWSSYGTGVTGGNGHVPRLAGEGCPTTLSRLVLRLSDAAAMAPALILLAQQRANVPLLGGTLLVTPIIPVALATDANGGATLPLEIPGFSGFLGVELRFQAFVLDGGAPQGVAITAGLEATLR